MITLEDLKKNEDVRTLITRADESLDALGYTEHSFAHVTRTAEICAADACIRLRQGLCVLQQTNCFRK